MPPDSAAGPLCFIDSMIAISPVLLSRLIRPRRFNTGFTGPRGFTGIGFPFMEIMGLLTLSLPSASTGFSKFHCRTCEPGFIETRSGLDFRLGATQSASLGISQRSPSLPAFKHFIVKTANLGVLRLEVVWILDYATQSASLGIPQRSPSLLAFEHFIVQTADVGLSRLEVVSD